MKRGTINSRWVLTMPDDIADRDAITDWERCRFASFDRHLHWGMRTVDVGAEHGWISALIGREYVGTEHMTLVEPGREMWINIRKIWEYNDLAAPNAMLPVFAGVTANSVWAGPTSGLHWPEWTVGDHAEHDAMAYGSLAHLSDISPPIIAIDDIAGYVDVLNVDIEGAELLALQGARRTLKLHRPMVWVSEHPDLMVRDFNYEPEQLHEYMARLGYGREYLGTDHEIHVRYFPLESE